MHGLLPKKVAAGSVQPASHEGARWRAGEHGIRSSSGDKVGSYLVHLADVTNSFVPTVAGACRSRSSDRRHIVHDDAAVHAQLLERSDVAKVPLTGGVTRHMHTVNSYTLCEP